MAERKYFNMKKDIHPDYRPVVFMDTTTGYQFLSGSTKHSNETVEFEGETYKSVESAGSACKGCAFDVDDAACFVEGFPPCIEYTETELRRVIFVKVA